VRFGREILGVVAGTAVSAVILAYLILIQPMPPLQPPKGDRPLRDSNGAERPKEDGVRRA
jgi:hypothetical protein